MSADDPTVTEGVAGALAGGGRSVLAPVPEHVTDAIELHCFSVVDREVGGVLLGRFSDAGTEVRAALAALGAEQASAHVTFTHQVWEKLLPVIDNDYPDMRIVGWYHTHPGFGLFLSEQDQFTHRSFFSDPRMVALVVDPRAGEAGWFGYAEDELVEISRTRTVTPAAAGAAGLAAAGSRRRSRTGTAVLAAAVLAVAAFGAGYGLDPSGGSGTSAADRSRIAALTLQRDQANAATDRVRGELATEKQRAAQRPASPAARTPVRVVTYRVRAGDTLSSLAAAFYGDPGKATLLAQVNRIPDPDRLSAGVTLTVPPG